MWLGWMIGGLVLGAPQDLPCTVDRTDMRLLGPIAEIRVRQVVRNPGPRRLPYTLRSPSEAGRTCRVTTPEGKVTSLEAGQEPLNLEVAPGGEIVLETSWGTWLEPGPTGWHLRLPRDLTPAGQGAGNQAVAHITGALPVSGVTSQTHGVDLRRASNGWLTADIRLREGAKALHLQVESTVTEVQAGSLALGRGEHVVQVQTPRALPAQMRTPLDVRVVLDPTLLPRQGEACLAALRRVIWGLGVQDRVAVGGLSPSLATPEPPSARLMQRLEAATNLKELPRDVPGALEHLTRIPRAPGSWCVWIVLTDGRGLGALEARLADLRREGDVCVVAPKDADPVGVARLAAGEGLDLGAPESLLARCLGSHRVPRITDLELDTSRAPGFALKAPLPRYLFAGGVWAVLGRQEPPAGGTLVLRGRTGSQLHTWSIPLGTTSTPLAHWPKENSAGMVPPSQGGGVVASVGTQHSHQPGAAGRFPYLCEVRTAADGCPPAELWDRVQVALLGEERGKRLAKEQPRDFAVTFWVNPQGQVSRTTFSPPLRSRTLQTVLDRALRQVQIEGWSGTGETRVVVPVHVH